MTTRPAIVLHRPPSGSAYQLKIWGATSYLHQFFTSSALLVSARVVPAAKVVTVGQHPRRRYPGGPVVTVEGHTRQFQVSSPGGGGARPGTRFWCERSTGAGAARVTVVRQFSYEGSWRDLKAFAKASVTGGAFVLRNGSGRSEEIIPSS